ncbi:Vacuolar ATPase assembly integral membrane protein [Pichia californica]|nr:Vacuolar ATPase assembly integral membrane protein [[Candida] californica]
MNYKFGEKVKALVEASGIEKSDKDAILGLKRITYEEFYQAYKMHKDYQKKSIMYYMSDMKPIFDLYDDSKMEKEVKSEGYVKLMNQLRSEEKEREYRTLLKRNTTKMASVGVDGIGSYTFIKDRENTESHVDGINAVKEIKHQLTTIVNIMITVLSVGYAVWYWSGSSMGLSESSNGNGIRILMSLVASLLVLVAEVVVFGGYLRKVEEARDKEKKVVENRKVVETIVITGKSGKKGTTGEIKSIMKNVNSKKERAKSKKKAIK